MPIPRKVLLQHVPHNFTPPAYPLPYSQKIYYTILMWHKEYRDYPPDSPLIKEQRSTGQGLIGCEMHEPNGWGESFHELPKPKQRGIIARFVELLFWKHK